MKNELKNLIKSREELRRFYYSNSTDRTSKEAKDCLEKLKDCTLKFLLKLFSKTYTINKLESTDDCIRESLNYNIVLDGKKYHLDMWLFSGFLTIRAIEDELSFYKKCYGKSKCIDIDTNPQKIPLPKHKKYRINDIVKFEGTLYTIKSIDYYSNCVSYNLKSKNINADCWVTESRLKPLKGGV